MSLSTNEVVSYLTSPEKVGPAVYAAIEYIDNQLMPLTKRQKQWMAPIFSLLFPVAGFAIQMSETGIIFTWDILVKAVGTFITSQFWHAMTEDRPRDNQPPIAGNTGNTGNSGGGAQ